MVEIKILTSALGIQLAFLDQHNEGQAEGTLDGLHECDRPLRRIAVYYPACKHNVCITVK